MQEDLSGEQDDGGYEHGTQQQLRVDRMEVVYRDARKFLKNDVQIAYVESLFNRLDDFGNLDATRDLSISKFGDLWELEAKGFVLQNICIGVVFAHIPPDFVVVLGVEQKEYLGQPLKRFHSIRMEQRLKYYLKTHGE